MCLQCGAYLKGSYHKHGQMLKILLLAMYWSNCCICWPCSYKQTPSISLPQKLKGRERGRLVLSYWQSLQPSRKNWRENWMKELILTLNWKTLLFIDENKFPSLAQNHIATIAVYFYYLIWDWCLLTFPPWFKAWLNLNIILIHFILTMFLYFGGILIKQLFQSMLVG